MCFIKKTISLILQWKYKKGETEIPNCIRTHNIKILGLVPLNYQYLLGIWIMNKLYNLIQNRENVSVVNLLTQDVAILEYIAFKKIVFQSPNYL